MANEFTNWINSGLNTNRPIEMPWGTHVVDDTIVIPSLGRLDGVGACMPNDLHRLGTTLLWDGPQGKPMLNFVGTKAKVGGFNIVGAPIGMIVSWLQGRGAGKHTIYDVHGYNCDALIQFGEKHSDRQCDSCFLHDIKTFSCRVGIRFLNWMALSNRVQQYSSWDTKVHFEVHGGGKLHIQGCDLDRGGGTILKFVDPPKKEWRVNNGGHFVFNSIGLDAQNKDFMLLDDDGMNPWATAYFGNFIVSNPDDLTTPIIRCGDRTSVVIYNARRLPQHLIEMGDPAKLEIK